MRQVFQAETKDILSLMDKSIEQGMSVENLLKELDLPVGLLSDTEGLIDFTDCWRIMIANQNAIQEESHLMSSRPLKKGTTRLVFSNLHHSNSLFEALSSIAETYNIVHGGDYNFVRRRGETLSFIVDDKNFPYADQANEFAIEFALIRIHCALSVLAGRPLRLARVCTKRAILPKHHHHLLIFNSKIVSSNKVYELVYDARELDAAFCSGENIDISGYIFEQYLELVTDHPVDEFDSDFVTSVRIMIVEQSLKAAVPNQELVAAQLNMSVATLRRKLAGCRLNYRQVLDKVCGELSVNLLHDGLSFIDVATRLGYSDERSFKRAFLRWHGQSPAAYRQSHLP